MKKILFIIITIIVLLISCELEPEYEEPEYEEDNYITYTQYTTLLDNLNSQSNITKTTITTELSGMNLTSEYYDYSYYENGDYSCYNFNWSRWGDSSFDYYIDVDIWTENGSLKTSMCSYYEG